MNEYVIRQKLTYLNFNPFYARQFDFQKVEFIRVVHREGTGEAFFTEQVIIS